MPAAPRTRRRGYSTAGCWRLGAGAAPGPGPDRITPPPGAWTYTGSMHDARFDYTQTATLLNDGRVLVAGGCAYLSCEDERASAELYDPATGTWSYTGSMHAAREDHTATLLQSGQVL